ncbi:MAG: hypothetical protein DWI67_01300 [Chloroflexi bacterium]|nr:MAG: hypothetical protein DWI67_01300 [Chloroflexota bacterium]
MAAGAARRGAALAFALLFAAACGGQPLAVAVVPTASPQPTVTPVPPTAVPAPRVLTVCLENEPASLYIYSAAGRGWNHVQEALRDGPIDRRSFGRQPIILERLPDWENGDVTLESVVVAAGAGLVTADGDLDRLAAGVPYWTPDMERVLARADTAVTTIQMRVTFRLREDVRWSDGAPLTADDSVFGFEIGSAAATPGSKLAAWRTASYSASDAHTITWVGQPGYYPADVLESLAEPLARHAYGNLDAAQLLADEQANRAPLGWGAFRVAQWEPGLLRLVRNKYYFRAAEGLPRVDEVHFRTLPDESVALSAVAGGECQIAVRDSWEAWEDSADALLAAQSSGQLAVQLVPGPVLEQLGFGILMAPGLQRKAGADLFQAVALRQALAHCVDREALADAAQWGQGSAAAGFVPAAQPLQPAPAGSALPEFDVERAQALLQDAGWLPAGDSGVRFKQGRALRLRYAVNFPLSNSGFLRQAVAELLRTQLRACGVDLQVQPFTSADLYGEFPAGVLFGRQFDLAQFAWLQPGEPRCELFTSAELPGAANPGGSNYTGYRSAAYDSACSTARFARTRAAAQAAHAAAQQLLIDELPALPLFFRLRIGVAQPGVRGLQLDASQPSPLWNIEELDFAAPS